MSKRQIKVQITPDGQLKFDNSKNPDEQRILDELAELAALLNGDPKAVTIEKHVGGHSHIHTHSGEQAHVH